MMTALLIIIGVIVGSFLTALTHRMYHGGSVVRGRSRCPSCGVNLGPRELIPIASFFFQRGRCRHCANRISRQYPAIEVASAALFGLVAFRYDCSLGGPDCWSALAIALVAAAMVLAITVYDLRWMIIPDEFLFIVLGAVLAAIALSWGTAAGRLAGAAVLGGFLLALFAGSRGRAMGFGDVKLGVVLGALVGWPGGVVALGLAFLAGGVVAAGLLIAGAAGRSTPIPFGPFLAGAGFVTLLWGTEIIEWYEALLV